MRHMAPIRPENHEYAFHPNTLDALRKQLGLTQAALAEQLDVPVNTVSRWETGATTPDAKALAAIFSIAKECGVTPQFFKRRESMKQKQKHRTQLYFVWDFQNHGVDASDITEEWSYVQKYLKLRFPKASCRLNLWAYTSLHQMAATQELRRLGFRVSQSPFDLDSQIIQDVRAVCLDQAIRNVFILVTDDGSFTDLLVELTQAGVDAYVWGTDECSVRLQKALQDGNFVHWDAPFVITECVEVIKEIEGKSLNRAEFGNRCKIRLEEYALYPEDVGFSKRNPYGSVLRWLEAQGLIRATKAPRKPDSVTLELLP